MNTLKGVHHHACFAITVSLVLSVWSCSLLVQLSNTYLHVSTNEHVSVLSCFEFVAKFH